MKAVFFSYLLNSYLRPSHFLSLIYLSTSYLIIATPSVFPTTCYLPLVTYQSMPKTTLFTSFDIWKQRHTSNSSDDLLGGMIESKLLPERSHFLRKLPVDFQLAPKAVIAKINELKPQLIICCGMAEKRKLLAIESNGKSETEIMQTTIDVHRLVTGLIVTRVSHNAGKFVCNALYYSVLKHIQTQQLNSQCVFIHVPRLDAGNRLDILKDFSTIVEKLQAS
jgi:pyroglutamyl-peptidase